MSVVDHTLVARFLAAVNRLRRFTAAELAANAGLDSAAAAALMKSHADLLEAPTQADDTWRLRPAAGRDLAKRLAAVRHALDDLGRDTEDAVTSKPDILELVELTIDALEHGRPADPEARDHEMLVAGLHLSAHEAALRDRWGKLEEDRRRTQAARSRIRRLELTAFAGAGNPSSPPNRQSGPPRWSGAHRRMRDHLFDWTSRGAQPAAAELEPETVRNALGPSPAGDQLDRLLSAADRDRDGLAPFADLAPAAILLECRRALDEAELHALRDAVVRRTAALQGASDGLNLGALAAAAVALDATEAVDALFRSLLLPRLSEGLPASAYLIALASLANLARPRRDAAHHPVAAAAACHFLMVQRAGTPAEMALLAPAALGTPDVDAPALLDRLASVLFREGGLARALPDGLEEGSLARNLALALQPGNFGVLQRHLGNLLEMDYGRDLVEMLTCEEHEALELRDTNQGQYIVRMGRRVAQHLGSSSRPSVPLAIEKESEGGQRLRSMMVLRAWTRAPSPAPTGGAQVFSLSERLAARASQRRASPAPAPARGGAIH